jgi:hypothetical protein
VTQAARSIQVVIPIQAIKSWAAIVTEDKPVNSLLLRDPGRQIHPATSQIQVIKSWAAIVTEDKLVSSLLLRDPVRLIHPG